jgi:hypothetical protein
VSLTWIDYVLGTAIAILLLICAIRVLDEMPEQAPSPFFLHRPASAFLFE